MAGPVRHGAQTRNIEVGALINDATFARSLVQQWRGAADAGFFRRIDLRPDSV